MSPNSSSTLLFDGWQLCPNSGTRGPNQLCITQVPYAYIQSTTYEIFIFLHPPHHQCCSNSNVALLPTPTPTTRAQGTVRGMHRGHLLHPICSRPVSCVLLLKVCIRVSFLSSRRTYVSRRGYYNAG